MEDEFVPEGELDIEETADTLEICDCGECEECILSNGECTCGDCDICQAKEEDEEEDIIDELDEEDLYDDAEPEDFL